MCEGTDTALAEVKSLLPDNWTIMIGEARECRFCDGWWATVSRRSGEPPYYPQIISSEDGHERGLHHMASPAEALRALAANIREKKNVVATFGVLKASEGENPWGKKENL